MRRDAIYHSTYTGKPPDEPAVLGVALNEVFVPLLQKQFTEITDFYLPPEGCSYRMAIVQMKKSYPGHAKRVMFGVWSFLRQFMYTKFIVVVDEDVNIRDWKEVIWAITTRIDPARDTVLVDRGGDAAHSSIPSPRAASSALADLSQWAMHSCAVAVSGSSSFSRSARRVETASANDSRITSTTRRSSTCLRGGR